MKQPDDLDPNSKQLIEREWRFLRNSKVRTQSMKQFKKSRKFVIENLNLVVGINPIKEIISFLFSLSDLG